MVSLIKKQPPNLKSALDLPEVTKEKIIKEIRVNRVKGPFDSPPKLYNKYILITKRTKNINMAMRTGYLMVYVSSNLQDFPGIGHAGGLGARKHVNLQDFLGIDHAGGL